MRNLTSYIINMNDEDRTIYSPVSVARPSNARNIQHVSTNVDDTAKVQRRLNGKIMEKSTPDPEYLLVEVRYPRTYRHEDKGKFTDYEIYIETNKIAFSRRTSTVRRRFSEFLWLRKQLGSVEVNGLGKGNVPDLPPKKVLGRFQPTFLDSRQQGLEIFLRSILVINKFLSYSGLHLFLQSPMTVDEIEGFLVGKYGDKSVEDMLEDFGCATNTDNPFSIFLRKECKDLLISRSGRTPSYDRFLNTESHGDNVIISRSAESSVMSSGSFPGVFLNPET